MTIFGPGVIICIILVVVHWVIMYAKYQSCWPSGFREEDFLRFLLYKSMLNLRAPGRDHFWPGGRNLNNLGRGPLGDCACKISKL